MAKKTTYKHIKGLLPTEWVVLAYLALTSLWILFAFTRMQNPLLLLGERFKILALITAVVVAYTLRPCRFTLFCRIAVQFLLLAWWYPDTYEMNRVLPNLDHLFCNYEQQLFGFQPALWFSGKFNHIVVSEMMNLGYWSYYPMIAVIVVFYFFRRQAEFLKATFVIIAAFMIYYVIFDFLPVAGPTFYYHAVGVEQISKGIFPELGNYFNSHSDCLPTPGYSQGVFYQLVESAKAAGERPTAAFPSSHVGISTICMLLAVHTRQKRLAWLLMPFYILLCLATVYIQAHYAIDALAGLLSGTVLYFVLMKCHK